MLRIDFSEITARADLEKLLRLFVDKKNHIYELLLKRLREQGPTPYIDFVADQSAGQERTKRYLDAFEEALRGRIEIFFNDQKEIGYKRAMEGYRLEDVYTHKIVFKKVLLESLNANDNNTTDKNSLPSINDTIFLDLLIDYSNYLLSSSFLKTRDDIISRRRKQIRQLYNYAARVVSLFNEDQLKLYAMKGIFSIFGLYSFFPSLLENGKTEEKISDKIHFEQTKEIADRVIKTNEAVAVNVNDKLILFKVKTTSDHFKAICMPLNRYNAYLTDPLYIHNKGQPFKFDKPDRNLLYQFCYFTGSVLSNCLMVSQLDIKQRELHMLAGKLITIKEEEEKRIAAEIHDTITQALTAIGYRALVCQKLLDKDPNRLDDEMHRLTENINVALKQSREIISNLRPRILDDLGMIPAFKRMVADFRRATSVKVDFTYPKGIKVDPRISISLFRIFQEALQNIKRHAQASRIWISIALDKETNQLTLKIQDNGKGFAVDSISRLSTNSGIGILIMQERAEDLGGKFEIISRDGEGCELTVTLPLKVLKT